MVILTGGAGFIGSAFLWKLNQEGIDDVIVVDQLGESPKWKNLVGLRYKAYYHKEVFIELIQDEGFLEDSTIDAVIHMGACSSTTEMDMDYLMENNVQYSKLLCAWAFRKKTYFMYASSAATYGDGELGFSDFHETIPAYRPINPYGYSKQLFDLHLLQEGLLDRVVGLKFFNVFGPNEYHKETMRSLVCKSYPSILKSGKMGLFKSYLDGYEDGGQMRDFIYVKDCVDMMWWLFTHRTVKGIYNIGTGAARSWNDLATALFQAMKLPVSIDYIEMPESIKNQYQYFTEAPMSKLQAMGCPPARWSLEEAIQDYIEGYLTFNLYLSV